MQLGKEAPSRLIPYTVKQLNMSAFDVPQFKLLSKAVAVESIDYMIEAMGEVLDYDATQLTDGDFHYLFAMQRVLHFEEDPLTLKWKCLDGRMLHETSGLKREFTLDQMKKLYEDFTNAPDEEKINFQDPYKLMVAFQVCNHENIATIGVEDLHIVQVPEIVELDPRLVWPRVSSLADANLMKRDPEKANLVDATRWVPGETMNEKFKNLEEGGIALFKAATRASSLYAHGYRRTIDKQCSRCGTTHNGTIDVDAAMFFQL